MISKVVRLLKTGIVRSLGRLGYGLIKLSDEQPLEDFSKSSDVPTDQFETVEHTDSKNKKREQAGHSGKITVRHALVTGGAGGIGLAIAKRLADLGHGVYALDPAAKDLPTIDARIIPIVADVRDYVSTADAMRFDIVVLNVAIFGEERGLNELMAVNLYGNIAMIDRVCDGGRVIVIGTGGYLCAEQVNGLPRYLTTKAALSAYCRGMVQDLASRGVSVNEILCNDSFDTAMGRAAGGGGGDMASPSLIADAAERIVAGEFASGVSIRVDRNGAEPVTIQMVISPTQMESAARQ